jgi:hypothetical protein
VSAGQVELIRQCAECLQVWLPVDEDRWRAYLDTEDELVFYCPDLCRARVQLVKERRGVSPPPHNSLDAAREFYCLFLTQKNRSDVSASAVVCGLPLVKLNEGAA